MISIIIPAFNCGQSIINTLESIDSQSLIDTEIIVVDDGSTDDTKNVIKQYIRKAPEKSIHYIWQENSGASEARNTGLDFAKGDYIYFCDADDIVPQGAISEMLHAISGCELVVGNYLKINNDGKEQLMSLHYSGNLSAQSAFELFFSGKLFISLWNVLFKKSVIDKQNLRFKKIPVGEDVNFIANYLFGCNTIRCIDKIVYKFFYDKNRTFMRETNHICYSVEESCYEGLVDKSKFIGWNHASEILENGRIPVFAIIELLKHAFISRSFSDFCEQLTDCKKLINVAKRLKRGAISKSVFLKTQSILMLFIWNKFIFYYIAKKLYKKIY